MDRGDRTLPPDQPPGTGQGSPAGAPQRRLSAFRPPALRTLTGPVGPRAGQARGRSVAGACLAVVTVLALGLASLAGCSRQDQQAGPTTTSPAATQAAGPSRTASPTPTRAVVSPTASLPPLPPEQEASRQAALATPPPERPAGMDEQTPEGAIATGMYLLSLIPYSSATGDLTQWQDYTEDTNCTFCQSVIDDVTDLHVGGGWEEPWTNTVTDSGYADPEQGYSYSRVDLLFDHDAVQRYDGSGGEPKLYEAKTDRFITFALIYRDDRWLLGAGEYFSEEDQ